MNDKSAAAAKAPIDIDGYLVTLPKEFCNALEELRRIIGSAAPQSEECIS